MDVNNPRIIILTTLCSAAQHLGKARLFEVQRAGPAGRKGSSGKNVMFVKASGIRGLSIRSVDFDVTGMTKEPAAFKWAGSSPTGVLWTPARAGMTTVMRCLCSAPPGFGALAVRSGPANVHGCLFLQLAKSAGPAQVRMAGIYCRLRMPDLGGKRPLIRADAPHHHQDVGRARPWARRLGCRPNSPMSCCRGCDSTCYVSVSMLARPRDSGGRTAAT
jgi:hypothetical protein